MSKSRLRILFCLVLPLSVFLFLLSIQNFHFYPIYVSIMISLSLSLSHTHTNHTLDLKMGKEISRDTITSCYLKHKQVKFFIIYVEMRLNTLIPCSKNR